MYTRMQTPNLTLNFGGKGRGVEGVWEGWRMCGRGGEGGKGRGVEGVREGGGVETMMHVHTNAQQCDR